jgi:hypothetical protein
MENEAVQEEVDPKLAVDPRGCAGWIDLAIREMQEQQEKGIPAEDKIIVIEQGKRHWPDPLTNGAKSHCPRKQDKQRSNYISWHTPDDQKSNQEGERGEDQYRHHAVER